MDPGAGGGKGQANRNHASYYDYQRLPELMSMNMDGVQYSSSCRLRGTIRIKLSCFDMPTLSWYHSGQYVVCRTEPQKIDVTVAKNNIRFGTRPLKPQPLVCDKRI